MIIQNLADATISSLLNTWGGVIGFIPSLIGALIILIIGLIVAAGLKSLVERILSAVKLDNLLRRLEVESYFQRAGMSLNSGKFFGSLVYWFFVIVFVLAAADTVGLRGLSQFLGEVVAYIPNIIVAALIMLVTALVASALRTAVSSSVMSAKLHASKFLGTLVWWAVVVFGFISALIQLGIAPMLLNTLITGLVAMLALAGGIAFGLGGKDYAAYLLNKLKERVE
ncbi:MAG: Conserved TM helix repeat-containing protein [Candidatus Wolfebacteria bacterium GW2011_GWA1_44_24]|uniref:Conserved TM helix repeat-containing protein n=2 Tax=Candidatus Wolfeibacteriota TaxID=1752735 RepID=A0A0G0UKC8_9BACT|nr:MAG: Conserved TM helix repeat-containing protein [Candidatus Wolfebacteria bacterium GW2011_GWB1_41_12]KKT56735.1 MAG: Conserved TM helix repeat-containing protein [Candidatus Wolfebacteria bacterium GW2011_GWA1_44_24]